MLARVRGGFLACIAGYWSPVLRGSSERGAEQDGDRVDLLEYDAELARALTPATRKGPGARLGTVALRLDRGDLFRPWQEESASFSRLAWTVIEPTTIAVLDRSFAARAREVPQLLEALTERALRRSRRLAVNAAIANTVGVEERLLLILWQLAELWGKKAPGGVVLSFRLSHQTLADLVGARHPTVTLGLRNLAQREVFRRGDSGEWILVGDPP
jgi:hypothetical protein